MSELSHRRLKPTERWARCFFEWLIGLIAGVVAAAAGAVELGLILVVLGVIGAGLSGVLWLVSVVQEQGQGGRR